MYEPNLTIFHELVKGHIWDYAGTLLYESNLTGFYKLAKGHIWDYTGTLEEFK